MIESEILETYYHFLFAGACLLPTRVLAYIQIGTFIVIVISVSWFFSTFFLLSVLSVAGSGPTIDCQDKKDCLKKVRQNSKLMRLNSPISLSHDRDMIHFETFL